MLSAKMFLNLHLGGQEKSKNKSNMNEIKKAKMQQSREFSCKYCCKGNHNPKYAIERNYTSFGQVQY